MENFLAYTTPSLLWRRHAAAREQALAREARQRSDPFFADASPIVCGLPLRLPTPDDLLVLDRLGNALVLGAPRAEIAPAHVDQFLWQLAVDNRPGLLNAWRLGRFLARRRRVADAERDLLDVLMFLDGVFQDAPQYAPRAEEGAALRPPSPVGAHFLASLLVPLAAEVGPFDPLDGRPWQAVPLPRIFQYLKVAARRRGDELTEITAADDAVAAWLAEVNAARAAGLLVGEAGIPGSRDLAHLTAEQILAAHGHN